MMARMERVHLKPLSRPKGARSKVSNGRSRFVGKVDSRTAEGRRLADLIDDFEGQIPERDLSAARKQLVRRAASASLSCEQLEARLAAGDPIDHATLIKASGLVCRLLRVLGIAPDRKPGATARPPEDLESYLASQGHGVDADDDDDDGDDDDE